ncbi:MAG TPA: arginine deiminase family protein [Terriglobales bacterium]|nr:arginine deiminase family protein [Terriglobales bacterium]
MSSSTIQSMVGDLKQVLVCSPQGAGWDRAEKAAAWLQLGFHQAPNFRVAQSQHEELCRLLEDAGAEVVFLPHKPVPIADAPADSVTLDAVYTHDASFPTDFGLILMNPGKATRVPEGQEQAARCGSIGIGVLGAITAPGTSEAGDIVWLDRRTLVVGNGYRTNRAGIEQLRALVAPKAIEVLSAPLPYGPGPSACLHLMSLMSLLDEHTILVDLPWLAVETVELLRRRGFDLLEIDYSERDTLACNVLSLGSKRLIALEENAKTNRRLRDAGFDVRTFTGSELCINGSGGPTCLTRPLLRR